MTYTRIYPSPTKLPGGDGPITLKKAKVGPTPEQSFAVGEKVRLIPGTTFDYALASEVAEAIANPPVVVPPVVTPPAPTGVEAIHKNGTLFLGNDKIKASIGPNGFLTSDEPVPDDWPTASDRENTVTYIGMRVPGHPYDLIARGAIIAYLDISYREAGVTKYLRSTAFGANNFTGSWDGMTWRGTAGPFNVTIVWSLTGMTYAAKATIAAARGGNITDVRVLVGIDADQDASMANVFTIRGRGTVDAAPVKAGPTMTLTTADARATAFGIPNLMLPKPTNTAFNTAPKIGSTSKGDGGMFLLFRLPDLAVGQSDSVTWSVGVK